MTPLHSPIVDIEDPLEGSGWRVSRPDDEGALHTEVLRELCDTARVLHVGSTGERGVLATLQLVDVMQQQLVLASDDDGIAIARALQGRPVWAAARLHNLRVQFILMAASATSATSATRERSGPGSGAGFRIRAHWPRDIYRTSRRREPRLERAPNCAPLARFHHSNQLVSTREFTVMDISEQGAAVLLPARMSPPLPGSCIRRVELELDDRHIVFTDARVQYITALGRGSHRMGCLWEGMPTAGQRTLRRWLAAAAGGTPEQSLDEAAHRGAHRAALQVAG